MRRVLIVLAAGAVLLAVLAPAPSQEAPAKADPRKAADEEKTLTAALKKATAGGKYQMLLRQIKVPADRDSYGDFSDYGSYGATDYALYRDLPAGYWVYVAPYWYIWRDVKAQRPAKRSWGPEQATGPPDTEEAGDFQTAWASRTEDGQDEWLLLEYAEPVRPREVRVHESYNPGALARMTMFRLDGEEVEVWKGKDPSPVGSTKGISVIPVRLNFRTTRVKLYLNSREVPGWNEIDAVGLQARGKTHWASAADASSTYAEIVAPPAVPAPDPDAAALSRLENEVRQLKERARRLEERLKKRKKNQ